jgi:hypothetical protein
MICEVRRYRLRPGSMGRFLGLYAGAYEDRREVSQLAGAFTCEIGPLDQFLTIWPYASHAARAEIRAASAVVGRWPPRAPDILDEMRSEIFLPMPFCPEFPSGRLGPVFEWRSYRLRPDAMGAMAEVWGEAIEARRQISPLVMAMASEGGVLHRFVHLWAYESFAHRTAARAEAVARGLWPPRSLPEGTILSEDSMILTPTAFSPLQ